MSTKVTGLLIGAVPPSHVVAYGYATLPGGDHRVLILGEADCMEGGFFTMECDLTAAIVANNQKYIDQPDKQITNGVNFLDVYLGNREGDSSPHHPPGEFRKPWDLDLEEPPESIDFGHVDFLRPDAEEIANHTREWKYISFTNPKGHEFRPTHSLHFALADGQEVWTVSGSVSTKLKGEGRKWKTYHLVLEIPLPEDMLATNQYFQVRQWSTSMMPVVFSNAGAANDAGWGLGDYGGPYPVRIVPYQRPTVALQADVFVRDSDGFVDWVGYETTIIGVKCPLLQPLHFNP